MQVYLITLKLHANWVHSLKEKRMVVKSLLEKTKNKFNVSAAESDTQDLHQSIVISIAFLAADNASADSMYENIVNYIERHTDAEIVSVEFEER